MTHDGRRRKVPYDSQEAIAHLKSRDPRLGTLIDRVGVFGLRLDSSPSPFESLLESILYQQLNGKAAATIHGRVREIYSGDPAPKALIDTPDERLRAAGVSGNKAKALKDLAAKTLDGTVPTMRALRRMEDDAIVERLTSIRGIGRWTVEMLLIFRLGRPDVLPIDDYGVRKGLMRVLGLKELPTRAELAERGERWRPYRSAASWYLWRACELP